MHPLFKELSPREHVHIHGLASRVAVVTVLTAFSVVAIGIGIFLDLYKAVQNSVAGKALEAEVIRAGVIGGFLLIVALWLSLTVADMLVLRRVRRMVEKIRAVAFGDTTDVNQIPGGMGELDELTFLFDKMRNRMVEASSATDEKVRSRTADLEFNKGMAEFEQARTEALISSIGEAVIATDKEGRIIFINQETSHAMGWTAADLVGKKEEAVIVINDEKDNPLPPDKRPVGIALSTGSKSVITPLPKPHSMVRKDGSTYPVQVTVTPVVSGTNIIGAIEVIRDVTDEVELDRRKTEFISIASHQLRSPLAATKWLSDMLRNGDLGALQPKQQEIADKLFEANERMVVLVNELLNVSRLDSGVSKPTPKMIDGSKLLESVLSDTLPLLTAKKQKFAYDKPALPQAYVDELLIREVLVNLVSNASKYSPDQSTITVTAVEQDGMLQVGIRDEGIGIPKSDQNQLFKKFFRAGNALKSAVQGTGLGLYFVKSIVEMSGGQIWYDSEENKGTTFYVTLPLSAAPTAAILGAAGNAKNV